jgi:hypothetical protein
MTNTTWPHSGVPIVWRPCHQCISSDGDRPSQPSASGPVGWVASLPRLPYGPAITASSSRLRFSSSRSRACRASSSARRVASSSSRFLRALRSCHGACKVGHAVAQVGATLLRAHGESSSSERKGTDAMERLRGCEANSSREVSHLLSQPVTLLPASRCTTLPHPTNMPLPPRLLLAIPPPHTDKHTFTHHQHPPLQILLTERHNLHHTRLWLAASAGASCSTCDPYRSSACLFSLAFQCPCCCCASAR